MKPNQAVTLIRSDGKTRNGRIGQVLGHLGLQRYEAQAFAGDIIAITGLGDLNISDTICDINNVEALPALSVDEPTVTMFFCVNTSPFCGKRKICHLTPNLGTFEKRIDSQRGIARGRNRRSDAFRVSGRGPNCIYLY